MKTHHWIGVLTFFLVLASYSSSQEPSNIMNLLRKAKIPLSPSKQVQLVGAAFTAHQIIPVPVCVEQMSMEARLLESVTVSSTELDGSYGSLLKVMEKAGIKGKENKGIVLLQSDGVLKKKKLPLDAKCPAMSFKGKLSEFWNEVSKLMNPPLARSSIVGIPDEVCNVNFDGQGTIRDMLCAFSRENPYVWSVEYEEGASLAQGSIAFSKRYNSLEKK